uniref:Uncharacterized protein n=1 Tax=Arundo donax TaxID=35708 RepID=A0A0A9APS1_ARUDO
MARSGMITKQYVKERISTTCLRCFRNEVPIYHIF